MARNPETQDRNASPQTLVNLIDDRVLLVKEPKSPDPQTIDLIFDQIDAMSANWEKFYLIVEYPADTTISADARARVRERFSLLQKRIAYLAAVVKNGVFVRLNFMLMAKWTGYRTYTIHSSFERALSDVRERMKRDQTPV
jgi:hypothetical protein